MKPFDELPHPLLRRCNSRREKLQQQTDPRSGEDWSVRGHLAAPRALATLVTDQLAGARGDAESRSVAAELDADLVLMAVGGLAQGMLQGYSTRHSAEQLIEHLLDRVLQ
ncbi:hypothetical protein [Rhodococcoides fascians]|uniref:hypothetical protein n=1 Tax=Rhodococcoides fascians TaxID=1828 RepID=UPI000AC5622D|nr:hypothetical protein [Rhodococcus fascians]